MAVISCSASFSSFRRCFFFSFSLFACLLLSERLRDRLGEGEELAIASRVCPQLLGALSATSFKRALLKGLACSVPVDILLLFSVVLLLLLLLAAGCSSQCPLPSFSGDIGEAVKEIGWKVVPTFGVASAIFS